MQVWFFFLLKNSNSTWYYDMSEWVREKERERKTKRCVWHIKNLYHPHHIYSERDKKKKKKKKNSERSDKLYTSWKAFYIQVIGIGVVRSGWKFSRPALFCNPRKKERKKSERDSNLEVWVKSRNVGRDFFLHPHSHSSSLHFLVHPHYVCKKRLDFQRVSEWMSEC